VEKLLQKQTHLMSTFMLDRQLNQQAKIRAAQLNISKSQLYRNAIQHYIKYTGKTVKNVF